MMMRLVDTEMMKPMISNRKTNASRMFGLATVLGASLALSACLSTSQNHGHVIDPEMLSQVKVGASAEQVQLVLGSPDTTSTIGGKAYYYISTTRQESPFFAPTITDQHVLAVYFDSKGAVTQIANYGLQDGVLFDFIQRKTVTAGKDISFVNQVMDGLGKGSPVGDWGKSK